MAQDEGAVNIIGHIGIEEGEAVVCASDASYQEARV